MQTIRNYARRIAKKIGLQIPVLKNYIKDHDHYIKAYAERYNEIGFAPGHFLSPIPSLQEVKESEQAIFEDENILDIDLNLPGQFLLLQQLKNYYDSIPYNFFEDGYNGNNQSVKQSSNFSLRYKVKDAWYRYSDVIFLTAVMRYFKPAKIIEIGSGHSSAVMLDTSEIFFQKKINFTFIEPFPEKRLYEILKKDDKESVIIIKNKIQHVETGLFESLNENDILFIDSTHISKTGSDVNYIFFKILPVLKPGVLIHFHDIFYPFELPKKWIFDNKWFWNEIYILRAFLMNNNNYEVLLFNSMLHVEYEKWFREEMPACLISAEETGSIWIRKIKN